MAKNSMVKLNQVRIIKVADFVSVPDLPNSVGIDNREEQKKFDIKNKLRKQFDSFQKCLNFVCRLVN
jgi:hypothetical protein